MMFNVSLGPEGWESTIRLSYIRSELVSYSESGIPDVQISAAHSSFTEEITVASRIHDTPEKIAARTNRAVMSMKYLGLLTKTAKYICDNSERTYSDSVRTVNE
mmetsp:Transcript_40459/g.160581  ORF Transcript_40459/g.160581 Transcript_40459/m.160581 type:complete len:104 (-) Transcript_40459:509-820(-)